MSPPKEATTHKPRVPSLLTLTSLTVSSHYPFQLIEERYKLIPEPVLKKIIFHAFPRQPKDVLMYSNNNEEEATLLNNYTCHEVLQVGFLLTGKVKAVNGNNAEEVVRVNFDRCKITQIACTCANQNKKEKLIFWCDHVVALALYRIKQGEKVELRVPISETLLHLTRPQLQKLVQYLISDHPSVLPTAQTLADALLTNKSTINSIHGAPDPTAGAGLYDDNSWAFNEQNLEELIKENCYDEVKLDVVVTGLIRKIHLMTRTSDSNAPKILMQITQALLTSANKSQTPISRTPLWDKLLSLWQLTVMNPSKPIKSREQLYLKTITTFNSHPNIPVDENSIPLLTPCFTLLKTDYSRKSQDILINCLKIHAYYCHGFKSPALKLCFKVLKKIRKSDLCSELDLAVARDVFRVFSENAFTSEGLEFALLCLAQERKVPGCLYLQEKWLKSEEAFLSKLKITDRPLLEKYLLILLDKNYGNCLPLYNFGKFIYKNVQNSASFKLCIKYLMMPIPHNTFIQMTLDTQQVNLALLLINASKNSKKDLDTILKTVTSHVKSTSSLFRIAQESNRLEETNQNLLDFGFDIGLHVLRSTLKVNHRRRWDIVRWVLNSALNCGFYRVVFLLTSWNEFFTPNEAVQTVASQFLSRGTSLRLNLGFAQQQRIGESARAVAIGAVGVDPSNCAFGALTICEADPSSFDAVYTIILNAAKQQNLLNCQEIFRIARYMEQRGYPLRAYKLAAIAIGHLHIPFNQETHSSISDIHWTCTLAQSLGDNELANLLPLIISNIKCASVLSEILKRAAMEPPRKLMRNNYSSKIYSRLKLLVEATINSYVTTIHNRLSHISPRHYADFIEYLSRAKECFLFAPDGVGKFRGVVEGIKREYKGKKKLLLLVVERFG